MRTQRDIEQDYAKACAELGDALIKERQVQQQLEAMKAPLLDRIAKLLDEAKKLEEVQKAIQEHADKVKAEIANAVPAVEEKKDDQQG